MAYCQIIANPAGLHTNHCKTVAIVRRGSYRRPLHDDVIKPNGVNTKFLRQIAMRDIGRVELTVLISNFTNASNGLFAASN